jgi:hypothetical protein
MGVFWVTPPAVWRDSKYFAFAWDVPDADTIEALVDKLVDDGIVAGDELVLVDDGCGAKMVSGRKPRALTAYGIAQVVLYQYRCREPEDDAPEPLSKGA